MQGKRPLSGGNNCLKKSGSKLPHSKRGFLQNQVYYSGLGGQGKFDDVSMPAAPDRGNRACVTTRESKASVAKAILILRHLWHG